MNANALFKYMFIFCLYIMYSSGFIMILKYNFGKLPYVKHVHVNHDIIFT